MKALKSNQARAKKSLLPPNIKKIQAFFLILDGSLVFKKKNRLEYYSPFVKQVDK